MVYTISENALKMSTQLAIRNTQAPFMCPILERSSLIGGLGVRGKSCESVPRTVKF